MKASDITIGGRYVACVSGNETVVRVDGIRERLAVGYGACGMRGSTRTVYDVTNERTGRKTTFRSPQKFRRLAGKVTP